MKEYFLAIDIGASSGRHILGCVKDRKIILEEVHRFWNGMDDENGTLVWDMDRLYREILAGMKKCKDLGKIPVSVGIDTWGVDFVLLDKDDKMIGKAVGYRDKRTEGADLEVYRTISEEELYQRTGIQKQIFNTIYQLQAIKRDRPEDLERAETMLMVPDYLHFLLCGKKVQEYSNASTGQLLDPKKRDWDYELIDQLGFPRRIFQKILFPGEDLGDLTEDVQAEVGFNCRVILPPTHDTASAVMAVPSNEKDVCYISSGTWSLMGVEMEEPLCTEKGRKLNFTNEGGYEGKITYLANIMGLWMIQSVRNAMAPEMSYGELCEAASRETIDSIVDCQDESFLAPKDMAKAVRDYCERTDQTVPEDLPQLACVIYNSLAKCYADKLHGIEEITGTTYDRIHIIGGGSNAKYLNELTARFTDRPVYAGPQEATALGNLLTQMIKDGVFKGLSEAREAVHTSFDIEVFKP